MKKENKLISSKTMALTITGAIISGVILSGAMSYLNSPKSEAVAGERASFVKPANGQVTLPVAQFNDGKARFYAYRHQGKTIRFFVVKSKDGKIRAAFDACDVCWRAGRGYTQKGDVMLCINCGLTFATNKINEVKGGCNPSPLKRHISGRNLTILEKDIKEGIRYFKLPAGGQ